MLWADSYPLTPQARIDQDNWDPVADNPYIHCQNGMPAIMDLGAGRRNTPLQLCLESR